MTVEADAMKPPNHCPQRNCRVTTMYHGTMEKPKDSHANNDLDTTTTTTSLLPPSKSPHPQEEDLKPVVVVSEVGRTQERSSDGDDNASSFFDSLSYSKTFPGKLFLILKDAEKYGHIVSWSDNGKSWKVHDAGMLEKEVMPNFFDMTKFSSFLRQINGWGFRRISIGPDRNAYYHEQFQRNQPEAVKNMRRRKSATQCSKTKLSSSNKVQLPVVGMSSRHQTHATLPPARPTASMPYSTAFYGNSPVASHSTMNLNAVNLQMLLQTQPQQVLLHRSAHAHASAHNQNQQLLEMLGITTAPASHFNSRNAFDNLQQNSNQVRHVLDLGSGRLMNLTNVQPRLMQVPILPPHANGRVMNSSPYDDSSRNNIQFS